jgi:hypothetical protein
VCCNSSTIRSFSAAAQGAAARDQNAPSSSSCVPFNLQVNGRIILRTARSARRPRPEGYRDCEEGSIVVFYFFRMLMLVAPLNF